MLAQSFKTPVELEISETVFNALVTVLGMLERGEISAKEFDMEYWWEPGRDASGRFCGTVGCIGGWTTHVARRSGARAREIYVGYLDPLYELFHPSVPMAWRATREQAVQAMRNYLTDGDPDWKWVMRD